jgi:Short C-terminal domain
MTLGDDARALPQLSQDRSQFWDGERWWHVGEGGRYYWNDDVWCSLPWWAQPDFTINVPLSGTYLGGHPQHPARQPKATLFVHTGGVTVQRGKTLLVHAPWSAIVTINIDGPTEFRRRASAARLVGFGALGYVTASGRYAYLTFETPDGPIAFEASHGMAHEIKPVLHPVLKNFAAQPAAQQPDAYEQLGKLNELRNAGAITEDEYEAKKRELLARL